jgi:hypothetical protein
MSDSIEQYMERPKRYEQIDGAGEMCMGVCALGIALASYASAALPKDSIWRHGFYLVIFMELIVIPFCSMGYFGSKAIKKYITYPRTGYVAYRRPKVSRWAVVLIVSLALALIMSWIAYALRHHAITPLRFASAGAVTLMYCLMGIHLARTQHWKWFLYGPLALGLMALFLTASGGLLDAAQPAMLVTALTYIASGAATFYLYMRGTKPGRIE